MCSSIVDFFIYLNIHLTAGFTVIVFHAKFKLLKEVLARNPVESVFNPDYSPHTYKINYFDLLLTWRGENVVPRQI